MSVALASTQTATGVNGSCSVTKPVGTAVGDLLICAYCQNGTLAALPVGFTELASNTSGGAFKVGGRIATGTESASYSFGDGTGGEGIMASISRITGPALDLSIIQQSAINTGTSTTATSAGITPFVANSLIIEIVAQNAAVATTSGYTLTTNPPTFTEDFDLQAGGNASLAQASGVRPEATATGTTTATLSSSVAWKAISLAISPVTSGSTTSGLLTATISLFTHFVNAPTASLLNLNISLLSRIQTKMVNTAKHASSWTNQNKS